MLRGLHAMRYFCGRDLLLFGGGRHDVDLRRRHCRVRLCANHHDLCTHSDVSLSACYLLGYLSIFRQVDQDRCAICGLDCQRAICHCLDGAADALSTTTLALTILTALLGCVTLTTRRRRATLLALLISTRATCLRRTIGCTLLISTRATRLRRTIGLWRSVGACTCIGGCADAYLGRREDTTFLHTHCSDRLARRHTGDVHGSLLGVLGAIVQRDSDVRALITLPFHDHGCAIDGNHLAHDALPALCIPSGCLLRIRWCGLIRGICRSALAGRIRRGCPGGCGGSSRSWC